MPEALVDVVELNLGVVGDIWLDQPHVLAAVELSVRLALRLLLACADVGHRFHVEFLEHFACLAI